MNNINSTNLSQPSNTYENNYNINNKITNGNDGFTEDLTIVKCNIQVKEDSTLSFEEFSDLCETTDDVYAVETIKKITASYTYNQYIEWLLNTIITFAKLHPSFINVGSDSDYFGATMNVNYSPLGYAVKMKKFNIAKELINIANLKQQQQKHDACDFIMFLQQEYLKVSKNNDPEEKKIKLQDAMLALTETYLNTAMNICDLAPLSDLKFTISNDVLELIIETKADYGCWNEIKQFFNYIKRHTTQYSSVMELLPYMMFFSAIHNNKPEFVIMAIREEQQILRENQNGYITFICTLNNYTLMKQCLAYIDPESEDFLIYDIRKGRFLGGFTRYINILNFCIEEHFNEAALAMITHGINIFCTQDIPGENYDIRSSQTALLIAIKANNYNIIKILIGLNAKQCNTDKILNSKFFYKPIENIDYIEAILDNTLSLTEIISIKFAYNLLQQMNSNLDASFEDIKEHIKQHNLLPPGTVNRIQSIEGLFLSETTVKPVPLGAGYKAQII